MPRSTATVVTSATATVLNDLAIISSAYQSANLFTRAGWDIVTHSPRGQKNWNAYLVGPHSNVTTTSLTAYSTKYSVADRGIL